MIYKIDGIPQFASLTTLQPVSGARPLRFSVPPELLPPFEVDITDLTFDWEFAATTRQQFDFLQSLMTPTKPRLMLFFPLDVSMRLHRKAWLHWGVIAMREETDQ